MRSKNAPGNDALKLTDVGFCEYFTSITSELPFPFGTTSAPIPIVPFSNVLSMELKEAVPPVTPSVIPSVLSPAFPAQGSKLI